MSSRMFLKVRDTHAKCYRIKTSFSEFAKIRKVTSMKPITVFEIHFGCENNEIEQTLLLTENEMKKVRINQDEFNVAKKAILTGLATPGTWWPARR